MRKGNGQLLWREWHKQRHRLMEEKMRKGRQQSAAAGDRTCGELRPEKSGRDGILRALCAMLIV